MDYYQKKEFLEHCKELARKLEEKTDKFLRVKIGVMVDWHKDYILPVTIMLNHENAWFGSFENLGWNEQVLMDNIGYFEPVEEDYLVLNKLIDEVY